MEGNWKTFSNYRARKIYFTLYGHRVCLVVRDRRGQFKNRRNNKITALWSVKKSQSTRFQIEMLEGEFTVVEFIRRIRTSLEFRLGDDYREVLRRMGAPVQYPQDDYTTVVYTAQYF